MLCKANSDPLTCVIRLLAFMMVLFWHLIILSLVWRTHPSNEWEINLFINALKLQGLVDESLLYLYQKY